MQAITDWFNGTKDYNVGVALYASLPGKKIAVLKRLNRGRNNHNMATLVSELRKLKTLPPKPTKKKIVIPTPKQPTTQAVINTKATRNHQAQQSVNREFGMVKLGDLPPQLRPKFLKAQTVFYNMIELKFALNDLPASAEESALKIQLQIEALDDQRDAIWTELHHWKNHKTLLEVPEDDFSKLDKFELDKTRRNLRSSVSKINTRINTWYNQLDTETHPHKQKLLENKINRSEKLLLAHEMNIKKLNELIT